MVIVVSASILYAINKKPENKAISRYEDDVDNGDDGNNEIDSKKEEKEFISEWISVIKERIEYENKLSQEQRQQERNMGVDKINWSTISVSSNPIAIELLKEYPDNICWNSLCSNEHPYAIELLKKYPGKINWMILCKNKNQDVIPLLKERIELEKTLLTSANYSQYTNKICWCSLSMNECMFELFIDRIEYEKINCTPEKITKYSSIAILDKIRNKDRKSLILFKLCSSVNCSWSWKNITDTIIQLSNLYYLREA
jgi:hypothetical protein